MITSDLRLSLRFPDARLNLSDEDTVVALALEGCSARSYAELIKSDIPSSSGLLHACSIASRPSPLSTLGIFSFGPIAATPTRGEILVHLGATSRKPRSCSENWMNIHYKYKAAPPLKGRPKLSNLSILSFLSKRI